MTEDVSSKLLLFEISAYQMTKSFSLAAANSVIEINQGGKAIHNNW